MLSTYLLGGECSCICFGNFNYAYACSRERWIGRALSTWAKPAGSNDLSNNQVQVKSIIQKQVEGAALANANKCEQYMLRQHLLPVKEARLIA